MEYPLRRKSRGKGSLTRKVLQLLGIERAFVRSHGASGGEGIRTDPLKQPKTFNLQAHISAKRRMHEIEKMKAMIIMESRHDRWKAGGPV